MNTVQVIETFQRYLSHENRLVLRAEFEANLQEKLEDAAFQADILPLLSEEGQPQYDLHKSAEAVQMHFISKLPGDLWKGSTK